jgi:flagellar hook-basal body complex protein FliE
MSIDGIRLYQAANQIGQLDDKLQRRTMPKDSATGVADTMGQMLHQAVETLDQGQKATDASIAKLVAGEPVDLHHVMLQMEESTVRLNLAIQIRNKVIEAYQEIQRMQV